MANVKFRVMTQAAFDKRFPEAVANAEGDDSQVDLGSREVTGYGEVKIPGHGWHGCALGLKGEPIYFYSDDDGWERCPKVTFEKVS